MNRTARGTRRGEAGLRWIPILWAVAALVAGWWVGASPHRDGRLVALLGGGAALGVAVVGLLAWAGCWRRGVALVAGALASLAAPVVGLLGGANALGRAYNAACVPSEEARLALLDHRRSTGLFPAALPPDIPTGERFLHEPLVRYDVSDDRRSFHLSCTDGWTVWSGSDAAPMRPAK